MPKKDSRGARPTSSKLKKTFPMIWFLLLAAMAASASEVRPSQFAGSWYPGEPQVLKALLERFTQQTATTEFSPPADRVLKALILPHAGYVYSGLTAAHAKLTFQGPSPQKVILMGPDHRIGFPNAVVSDVAAYATPLGEVALHADAPKLRASSPMFGTSVDSDRREHSLELVLPVLQHQLPPFELVPIVVGQSDPSKLTRALLPVIDARTLLVVSSDLSHFLTDEKAREVDRSTIQAILDLDIGPFRSHQNRACGHIPIRALIHLARHFGWQPALVHYTNSSDASGDRTRVVGYAAIAFYGDASMPAAAQDQTTEVTLEQGRILVRLARQTLLKEGGLPIAAETEEQLREDLKDPFFQTERAVFVTLNHHHRLRGCIGNLIATDTIVEGVRRNVRHAAYNDYRFKPVETAEIPELQIEVSVLSTPQPLPYDTPQDLIDKLRPNIDGVILKSGSHSATFLPQVWEQLPNPRDFLGHLCAKAGLSQDAWQKQPLEISIYQVQYFEEPA